MRSLIVLAIVAVAVSAIAIPLELSNTAECLMCEVGVKVADPAADKDAKIIEKDFIYECERVIPGKLGAYECKKYADKELGGIIKELESGTAPQDVCKKIKAC